MSAPGFFGKLPARGDFVERRLPRSFVVAWDNWLQQCLAASQANLGSSWLDVYLNSPIWNFALSPGVIDTSSYIGVFMPSVDKVGRYFPLSVVAECEPNNSAFDLLTNSTDWLLEVEAILLRVLDESPSSFETFDAAIEQTIRAPLGNRQAVIFPDDSRDGNDRHYHFTLGGISHLSNQLTGLLASTADRALGPHSIWLTRGSEFVTPSLSICPGLPDGERFTALLDGNWQGRHWFSQVLAGAGDTHARPTGMPNSAAITNVGKVRTINEDSHAGRDQHRIWIVADGLGGHQAGDIASSMVIGAIDQVSPDADIEIRVAGLISNLILVQNNLQQMAAGLDDVQQAASTVAALIMDETTFACVWAGDSRVYRLRDGFLDQLTRDHAEDGAAGENRTVTRAVGGAEPLELDVCYGSLEAGDRYLLCSDGLYQMLSAEALRAHLMGGTPRENCQALVDAVLETDAPDNLTALIVDIPDYSATNVYEPLV